MSLATIIGRIQHVKTLTPQQLDPLLTHLGTVASFYGADTKVRKLAQTIFGKSQEDIQPRVAATVLNAIGSRYRGSLVDLGSSLVEQTAPQNRVDVAVACVASLRNINQDHNAAQLRDKVCKEHLTQEQSIEFAQKYRELLQNSPTLNSRVSEENVLNALPDENLLGSREAQQLGLAC